jgi:hypothetical protein
MAPGRKFEIITINSMDDIDHLSINRGYVLKRKSMNKHNQIYYSPINKTYLKKYSKPMNSQFWYDLLTNKKFRADFTPHLTAIIVLEKMTRDMEMGYHMEDAENSDIRSC